MVYGFSEEIRRYRSSANVKKLTLTLHGIWEVIAINLYNHPVESISKGELRINETELKQLHYRSFINEDILRDIATRFICFIKEHQCKLLLCESMKARVLKSKTYVNDFFLKNNQYSMIDYTLCRIMAKSVSQETKFEEMMKDVYSCFLENDEVGHRRLAEIKAKPMSGMVYYVIEHAIYTARVRKLSKLSLDFFAKIKNEFGGIEFLYDPDLKNNITAISNKKNWQGKNDFTGMGSVFEPITFSELRHIKKQQLQVTYVKP